MIRPSLPEIKISFRAIARILSRPGYLLAAGGGALVFWLILRYLFSIQIVGIIVTSPVLSLGEKINLLLLGILPATPADLFVLAADPVGLLLLLTAGLAGVSAAVLVWTRRHAQASATRSTKGGFALSLLGSGCVACGGSILYPVLAGLGSAVSLALSRLIGITSGLVAIGLMLYGLWGLGAVAAGILARESRR